MVIGISVMVVSAFPCTNCFMHRLIALTAHRETWKGEVKRFLLLVLILIIAEKHYSYSHVTKNTVLWYTLRNSFLSRYVEAIVSQIFVADRSLCLILAVSSHWISIIFLFSVIPTCRSDDNKE